MPERKGPIPRLRFPEFRDAGPWEVKRLGDGIDLISGQHLGPSQYTNKFSDYPYFTGPSDFTDNQSEVSKWVADDVSPQRAKRGDVLVTVKGSGVGELWRLSLTTVAMGRQLMAVRGREFCPGFLFYFLHRKRAHLAALAAGNMIPGLSRDDLLTLPIPLPALPEQQKIADCFTSLDDLIRAEEGAVAALRDHKRGLMQQLFPRAGETTPRLRFPEFRNAGPWEVKRMGEVGTIIKGKGISKSDISEQGALPCIRYGELYTHYSEVIRNVVSFTNVDAADLVLSKENDVIIPASGETTEDIATASCVTTKGVALGGDLNVFRSAVNGIFLAYYIRGTLKPAIAKIAQGISVVHLYPTQLAQLKLAVPHSEEQQKIADCLTSLDDLIRAREARLDALRAHKTGLMQQLFPQEVS